MFTPLDCPIPVHVDGKGSARAIGMIDRGLEHGLFWLAESDETGEIWCAPHDAVRLDKR